MNKIKLPAGWTYQAYKYALQGDGHWADIRSHTGGNVYAYNWGLKHIESQLAERDRIRAEAYKENLSDDEAEILAKSVKVSWNMMTLRKEWNQVKREVAPWWERNSKESYSSGFSNLERAFKNYFDSRNGKIGGKPVGWPRYKSTRRGSQKVTFTTGTMKILDRHHVQLPNLGVIRTLEGTDKLRLKILSGQALAFCELL